MLSRVLSGPKIWGRKSCSNNSKMKSTKVQTLGAKYLAGRGRAKELLRVREALRKRMR